MINIEESSNVLIRMLKMLENVLKFVSIFANVCILFYLVYLTIDNNSTIDIEYYKKYFVISTRNVFTFVTALYGIHVFFICKHIKSINIYLLFLQTIIVGFVYVRTAIYFLNIRSRVYYSGISEDQLQELLVRNRNEFIITILLAIFIMLLIEVIHVVKATKHKYIF